VPSMRLPSACLLCTIGRACLACPLPEQASARSARAGRALTGPPCAPGARGGGAPARRRGRGAGRAGQRACARAHGARARGGARRRAGRRAGARRLAAGCSSRGVRRAPGGRALRRRGDADCGAGPSMPRWPWSGGERRCARPSGRPCAGCGECGRRGSAPPVLGGRCCASCGAGARPCGGRRRVRPPWPALRLWRCAGAAGRVGRGLGARPEAGGAAGGGCYPTLPRA